MAPYPRKNALRSIGYRDPDELEDFKQSTPMPSNAGPPDALVLDAPVPVPVRAKYIKEALETMTMFCIDLFPQAQASCPKLLGHQERF